MSGTAVSVHWRWSAVLAASWDLATRWASKNCRDS
jgi:hypothetical protein